MIRGICIVSDCDKPETEPGFCAEHAAVVRAECDRLTQEQLSADKMKLIMEAETKIKVLAWALAVQMIILIVLLFRFLG